MRAHYAGDPKRRCRCVWPYTKKFVLIRGDIPPHEETIYLHPAPPHPTSNQVAALAVRSMPWTVRAALLTSAAQLLWLLVSAMALGGSAASFQSVTAPDGTVYPASDCRTMASPHSCQCRGEVVSYNSSCYYDGSAMGFWVAMWFFASLVWGGAVIKNVVTATVTGSVASWWFSPGDANPVRGALHRAIHGSFG